MTALKIFHGATMPADDDIKIRDAFVKFLLPSIDGRRAKSTTSDYFTAIDHWESFCDSHHHPDPSRASTPSTSAVELRCQVQPVDAVSQINDAMLNAFGLWLMADKPAPEMTIGTAGKQWKKLRAILRRVGPREAGNPRGVGLIDVVPVMDPLTDLADQLDDVEGPADVTDGQIGRIYDACEIAVWPSEFAALQWRTYIVIASVMGPRVDDAATLTAENFNFGLQSPVTRSSRSYGHGWLIYRATKQRRSKPGRLILPLPPCVNKHVGQLLKLRGGRLFSWTSSRNHSFRDQWQQIVDQAGLSHVQRKHLRSTANIRWTRAGSGDDLGRWALGHAARDVNDAHYMRHEPDLIEAAPLVEVPEQFERRLGDSQTQTFLF